MFDLRNVEIVKGDVDKPKLPGHLNRAGVWSLEITAFPNIAANREPTNSRFTRSTPSWYEPKFGGLAFRS